MKRVDTRMTEKMENTVIFQKLPRIMCSHHLTPLIVLTLGSTMIWYPRFQISNLLILRRWDSTSQNSWTTNLKVLFKAWIFVTRDEKIASLEISNQLLLNRMQQMEIEANTAQQRERNYGLKILYMNTVNCRSAQDTIVHLWVSLSSTHFQSSCNQR